ncbi:MAG: FAD-dependent oxidoreductase [Gemmatimonadaceae bacterium]
MGLAIDGSTAGSQGSTALVATDAVVVGAGPAGIAAAVRASESGLRVVVLDEGFGAGGQIWRHRPERSPKGDAGRWLERFARSQAQLMAGTTVVDAHRLGERGFLLVAECGGNPVHVSAKRLILATGARERFIPFPGWTIPGVIGIGGAQALLKSGTSFHGKRVVIAGSGPLLLPVAAALSRAGARVLVVAEQASTSSVARFAAGLWRNPQLLLQAMLYRASFRQARYRTGTWALAGVGDDKIREVTLTNGRETWREAVDVLCTGYGLVPNVGLAQLLGCATDDGAVTVDAQQETTVPHVFAAGEVTGIGGAPLSIAEGEIAGLAATGRSGAALSIVHHRTALRDYARNMVVAFALREELRTLPTPTTVVCRCEDVPYGSLSTARSSRQAKLYTRAGMGPCQGRVCGPALEFLFDWEPDTTRSPLQPARVSTICDDVADITPLVTSPSH